MLGPAIIILGTLFKDKKNKTLPTDGAKIKMSDLDSKSDLQDLIKLGYDIYVIAFQEMTDFFTSSKSFLCDRSKLLTKFLGPKYEVTIYCTSF